MESYDNVTVEVFDGAEGYALLAAQQIAAMITSIGGAGALAGKMNPDFSNAVLTNAAALQQLAVALIATGAFSGFQST